MAQVRRKTLSQETNNRLLVLLKGETEIKPGYEGLTEEEAIEVVMLLHGVNQEEAALRVAFARGEITGDIEEE